MCGFIVAFALGNQGVLHTDYVESAVERFRSRGPDARGVHREPRVVMAHCRLRIVDQDPKSDQPFTSASGAIVLVYNGELYGVAELRNRLWIAGRSLRTQSDTEVLAECLDLWGGAILPDLDGMFAFAALDRRTGTLLAARDRFGIKPLYWGSNDQAAILSSSAPAVADYPDFQSKVSVSGLSTVLAYRYAPAGTELLSGTSSVEPGSKLVVRQGFRPELARYFQFRFGTKAREWTPQQVEGLVASSVHDCLDVDIPTTVLLSGGLDSSIIAQVSGQHGVRDAYVGVNEDDAYSELHHAEEAAAEARLRLNTVALCPTLNMTSMESLTRQKGAPVSYHNELAMCEIFEAVSKRVRVVLCGEGADEVFAGYPRIMRFPWEYRRNRTLRFLPDRLSNAIAGRWKSLPTDYADDTWINTFLQRVQYLSRVDQLQLVRDKYREVITEAVRNDPVLPLLGESVDRGVPGQVVQAFFLRVHLPGLLSMIDTASMAYSVEARLPYLRNWTAEFVADVPLHRGLRWKSTLSRCRAWFSATEKSSERDDVSKWHLRRAFSGKLSADTIGRRKAGFPVPLGSQIRHLLRDADGKSFFDEDLALYEFFERERVRKWIDDRKASLDESAAKRLLLLVGMEVFLRTRM